MSYGVWVWVWVFGVCFGFGFYGGYGVSLSHGSDQLAMADGKRERAIEMREK